MVQQSKLLQPQYSQLLLPSPTSTPTNTPTPSITSNTPTPSVTPTKHPIYNSPQERVPQTSIPTPTENTNKHANTITNTHNYFIT
jgi:hypothetical protein